MTRQARRWKRKSIENRAKIEATDATARKSAFFERFSGLETPCLRRFSQPVLSEHRGFDEPSSAETESGDFDMILMVLRH